MSNQIVLAFDAYGTLLSTESIAKQLASHFGDENAATLATTWRKYQLEYTWRANSMGKYEDFSLLTRRSLDHALAAAHVSLSPADTDAVMRAYDSLSAFPDVEKTMQSLRAARALRAVVFSNGTHRMVSSSVHHSPDLAPHAGLFDEIVVVEDVKKFKPAPEVYQHLARKVGKDPTHPHEMSEIWLVSGNPFDVVGARNVGMNAVWVDRAGSGWQDALVQGERGRPTEVVTSLDRVVPTVMGATSNDVTSQRREVQ